MPLGYYLVQLDSDGEPEFDGNGEPMTSGSPVELPVGRWGRDIAKERDNIKHVTELGREWIYQLQDKRTFRLEFDCLPAQLEIFRTLDEAVGGERDPFMLILDVDESPFDLIFVRKQKDFAEGEEQPVTVNGAVVRRVRYVLELREQPTGLTVTT